MEIIESLKQKVLNGQDLNFEEAFQLNQEVEATHVMELCVAAAKIREVRAGKKVDICSIVNAKSGQCSEDCRFCAQSGFYKTNAPAYSLLCEEEILERAKLLEAQGAKRFSLVMSGRGISKSNFEKVLKYYERLSKETNLKLCASLGIIDYDKAAALKSVGVSMYHHNLETSESYYAQICTTHTYDERVATIKAVQAAGIDVCSGGIISLGETMEHRLEMAFALRQLGIKSIPINILNPIEGTPLEHQPLLSPMEILKTIALFRFILPDAMLRYAGGRENALRDLQSLGYLAGINACLVGSYLTTSGRTVADDLQAIKDMGLEI